MSTLLRWLFLRLELLALRFERAGLDHVFNEYDENRSVELAAINERIDVIRRELAS